MSNIGSVKSSSHIGELRRGDYPWISRAVRPSHAARRTSTSFWRLPDIITAGGQAMVSSRLNHDINEQETGVDLALKLPQIAPITTTPGGRLAPRTALFYGFEAAARNDICLYACRGSSAWAPDISLQI